MTTSELEKTTEEKLNEQRENNRQSISNLEEVHEGLLQLGVDSELGDNSVIAKIGGVDHPFPVVFTAETEGSHLIIACQVMKAGEVSEENFGEFCAMLLDLNSRLNPYAFALITDNDDEAQTDEGAWPVILTDRVPFVDFSLSELEDAISSLRSALVTSLPTLKSALSSES